MQSKNINSYEEVTKRLLSDLGFNIDESLRAKINTSKDKIDVLINLGNNEVIIVEYYCILTIIIVGSPSLPDPVWPRNHICFKF